MKMRAFLPSVVLFLLASGTYAAPGSDNLIPNPSFEDPGQGNVSGWVFVTMVAKDQKSSSGVYLNDEATGQKQAHTGKCCVMIEGGTGAWLSPSSIEGKGNTAYKLTAWAKGEGSASVTVQTFDAAGKVKVGPVGMQFRLSSEWQQVEMGFVSEPDAAKFRIDLNSSSPGKVCFDDVSLLEDAEGKSLPKVNVWNFQFEGEKSMEGWARTQGATVTPSGDHLQIQGADWDSKIYRFINLRAGKYRLSGSGAGELMVYAAKDWSGKRMTMVNLSGKDFRPDEQTFDFPGGQLLLVVQAWGEKALVKVQWVEIALETLAAAPSPASEKR